MPTIGQGFSALCAQTDETTPTNAHMNDCGVPQAQTGRTSAHMNDCASPQARGARSPRYLFWDGFAERVFGGATMVAGSSPALHARPLQLMPTASLGGEGPMKLPSARGPLSEVVFALMLGKLGNTSPDAALLAARRAAIALLRNADPVTDDDVQVALWASTSCTTPGSPTSIPDSSGARA